MRVEPPVSALRFWSAFLAVSVLAALIIPPLIFLACLLMADFSLSPAWNAVVDQYGQTRQNPFLISVLGYLPVLLLALVVALIRWRKGHSIATYMATTGGLAITFILVWTNFEFWPNFLPGKTYPGFPHGLEIVIGSIFFAPAAMILALLVTGIYLRSR